MLQIFVFVYLEQKKKSLESNIQHTEIKTKLCTAIIERFYKNRF